MSTQTKRSEPAGPERILTACQAINEAFAIIGERNKDVLLFAEGIDDPSAMYGTTKNLRGIYGKDRIIEMPIAENGLCGVAIGAAMSGKRPVISFHRVEFALLAMEQIVNNAAKMHYVSNGCHTAPIVLRLVIGRGWGQGPEHSQSLESLFSYIPGLKVLMPTFPADYKGMLIAAIEDNNPVVIIEHRWTHYVKGHVDAGYYSSDITKPTRLKSGADITVVSSSYSTLDALKASEALAKVGVGVDLFDLRVTRPLVLGDIEKSVKKTGRLLTVDTGYKTLGIGSEIVAAITEHCFESLKAAPSRIGLPDHPTPSSRGYLQGLYPDAKKITAQVCDTLGLTEEKKKSAQKFLQEMTNDLPIDIPDPAFQGPF
jgi:pyruvate/2-oxoglutarate/acetoin dehydrogenase E1 component